MRIKKTLVAIVAVILLVNLTAKSNHILGGEISVQWKSGYTFHVTLYFYRDCSPNTQDFPAKPLIGIYDLVTNDARYCDTLYRDTTAGAIIQGDSCYQPTGLCAERGVFSKDIVILPNPHGYYLVYDAFNRSNAIINIQNAGNTPYTWYAAIPDPALQNSTPEFISYPRSYFCINYFNADQLNVVDVDGDSLVYSLTRPLSSNNELCPRDTAPFPKVLYQFPPYSDNNIIGGNPPLSIDRHTGVLTANPPNLGVFVFCIKIEEFTRGPNPVKLGEIRRDMQYSVIDCPVTQPVFKNGSNTLEHAYSVTAGDTLNLQVEVVDTSIVSLTLTAESALFTNGTKTSFQQPVTGAGSVESDFRYISSCSDTGGVQRVTFRVVKQTCVRLDTLYYDVDITLTPPVFDTVPNVFTPNGDNKNDFFELKDANGKYDRSFSVKIYNRWGELMFENNDAGFKWDGTDKSGSKAAEGVYYYIIEGFICNSEYKRRGTVYLKL